MADTHFNSPSDVIRRILAGPLNDRVDVTITMSGEGNVIDDILREIMIIPDHADQLTPDQWANVDMSIERIAHNRRQADNQPF